MRLTHRDVKQQYLEAKNDITAHTCMSRFNRRMRSGLPAPLMMSMSFDRSCARKEGRKEGKKDEINTDSLKINQKEMI